MNGARSPPVHLKTSRMENSHCCMKLKQTGKHVACQKQVTIVLCFHRSTVLHCGNTGTRCVDHFFHLLKCEMLTPALLTPQNVQASGINIVCVYRSKKKPRGVPLCVSILGESSMGDQPAFRLFHLLWDWSERRGALRGKVLVLPG